MPLQFIRSLCSQALSGVGLTVVLLTACTRSVPVPLVTEPPPVPASAIDLEIAEAVFRYQFTHNHSGLQQNASAYCVGIGSDPLHTSNPYDPPQDFVNRFRDIDPPVKAVSACLVAGDSRVITKGVERPGLIFRITSTTCTDLSNCSAEGGYYEGNESSSGNAYFLEKKAGKWAVTHEQLRWIS